MGNRALTYYRSDSGNLCKGYNWNAEEKQPYSHNKKTTGDSELSPVVPVKVCTT